MPLAKIATKVMLGMSLEQLGFTKEKVLPHWTVKEAVFPFDRFPNVDTLLGPEMKSTGEVMGIDDDLGMALAKSQMAANSELPRSGTVFISVRHPDKDAVVPVGKKLDELGYTIVATRGTAARLKEHGVACTEVALNPDEVAAAVAYLRRTHDRPSREALKKLLGHTKLGQAHLPPLAPERTGRMPMTTGRDHGTLPSEVPDARRGSRNERRSGAAGRSADAGRRGTLACRL